MAEAGLPGFAVESWQGDASRRPARRRRPWSRRSNRDIQAVIAAPETRAKLEDMWLSR